MFSVSYYALWLRRFNGFNQLLMANKNLCWCLVLFISKGWCSAVLATGFKIVLQHSALSNAGVTSSGNDSLLSGHDVAKTKYVQQVTASTLYHLMTNAFEHSKEEVSTLYFVEWCASNELENPQFQFWSVALKIEIDYLLFLRPIRSFKIKLYVESIGMFLPWVFALDHVHYARWLSIHHYDVEMLKDTNLEVFQEFSVHGNFTVVWAKNKFSKMDLDQRHEQLHEDFKGKQSWKPVTKRK